MIETDPNFITQANWKDLSDLLAALWMILGSALGLGGSMLLAHGMIPSLVTTNDLDATLAKRVRPPLYLAGVVFLGLALVSILLFIDRLEVISDIYYRGAQ